MAANLVQVAAKNHGLNAKTALGTASDLSQKSCTPDFYASVKPGFVGFRRLPPGPMPLELALSETSRAR
jgi:hypothetical protein